MKTDYKEILDKISTILLIWLFMVSACFIGCKLAHAETEYTVTNIYHAIATESIGEGKEGMEYVASCFWNRKHNGLSLGSVGVGRRNLKEWLAKQPEDLLAYAHQLADRVVNGVDDFDIVKGATHFESTNFPEPSWVVHGPYREVFRYKHHIFYKKVKK